MKMKLNKKRFENSALDLSFAWKTLVRVAVFTLVAHTMAFSAVSETDRLVPGSKKVDPVRQAAWDAANTQAKRRISNFESAVNSGNPERIRKATLDLQSDPLAVQHLNNSDKIELINSHNKETGAIKDATKQNIKQEMANKWNAEHPNDRITAADVDIKEPTNYKAPDAKPKAGQDWDVTVTVRGKDVPTSTSKSVVEDSYFKAAGGEKTFGKGSTPQEVAHRQSVEVTDSKSLEAYKEPDKILGADGKAPDTSSKLQNPEDLGQVIEYKSNQAGNKAAESRAKGNEVDAVRQDYEQMRQAVKQYDKVTDPRVKSGGGKVGNQVEEGMKVMRDVADMKISPEEGRVRLAEMGETPDSITRKAAGQVEAAQKLKPQTKPDVDKPKTTTETTKPDVDKPKTTTETTKPDVDKPKTTTETTKRTGPGKGTGADPSTTKTGDAPKAASPEGAKVISGDAPKTSAPESGKVAAPDAPKAAAPDAPKVAAPDAPKVAAPDAPKVVAPDVPSGKVGKALDAAGKIGDGIDIFAGAKDFSDAAKKGDTEGMKEAAVNTADSLTGGFYGTTKTVGTRAEDAGTYVEDVSSLDKTQMESAKQQQMTVDLRRVGYTKDQADKMVDSYASGDDSAVKDAYQKMGKDIPKAGTTAPETVGEAAGIYIAEVKENVKEVGVGIVTQAGKAKEFLKETAENLSEMGSGVTEKGVASELATQVKENVSPSNVREGYEAWKQNKDSDARVDEARKRLEEKLIEKGAKRSEAKEAADSYYGIGTEDGRDDRSKVKDLNKKLEKKENDLRDSEPKSDEAADDEDGGENSTKAGLKGFTTKRGERTDANAESSYGLMAEQQNVEQSSTRGDQAAADSKHAVDAAGADAQSTKGRSASSAAAAEKADSFGKAIADGVQQGIETGASALGSSFGGAAAKEVTDKAFGDPNKNKHHGGKGGGGGGASWGPDEGKGGGKAGGKGTAETPKKSGVPVAGKKTATLGGTPGDNKPATVEAPKTRRANFCKKCGSEMTYKGVYYADGTDMYFCPGCNATMHHVNGPCPWEVRDVPVKETPPAAPVASTPITPPTTSSGRPTKGKSGGTLVYCSTPGCNNAKEVLMGDTTAPYECSACFMKRYKQESGK